MTSELGQMCQALDAIGDDVSTMAQLLAAQASQLHAAASRAAAAPLSNDEGARGAAIAAQALNAAATACSNAAILLNDARNSATHYIRLTWTGGGSVNTGPVGGAAAPSLGAEPGDGVVPGLPTGTDVERVNPASVGVRPDLFDVEPAKSADQNDMIWAAKTFRDIVLPHVSAGGTKDQLRNIDHANGNYSGLRRLEGAWEVYLGDDMPLIDIDGTGAVDVTKGRHRILAAQVAGLTWIPMRVSRKR